MFSKPCKTLRGISVATAITLVFAAPMAMAAVGSWSTTGPYGGQVRQLEVYEPGPSTLIAAGRGGIFRSLSAGSASPTWQRIEVGLPDALYVQSIASSTIAPVIYLTNFKAIYRTGDNGSLWVPISNPIPAGGSISDVSVRRGTNNSIAISSSEGAYVSTNGGSTWSAVGASGTSAYFNQILFAADGSLYLGIQSVDPLVFGGASLLKSSDGGTTWAALPAQPPDIFGIYSLMESPVDPQRIYAGDFNTFVTSADGGGSWSAISLPTAGAGCGRVETLTPDPTSSNGVFMGCRNNGVHYAADVNAPVWTSWTAANGLSANGSDPVQASRITVHPGFPASPTIWVGTEHGGLFRTQNGGATWSPINNGFESANIRALAPHPLDVNPAGAVILAGTGDADTTSTAMYKSSDGGASWSASLSGLEAEEIRWLTIDPTTVDSDPFTTENFTVYASGRSARIPTVANQDGGIYKSTNAGNTWTTIDNGLPTIGGARSMGKVRAIALDPKSCVAPPCVAGSSPLQTVYVAGSGIANDPGMPYFSARVYKSTDAGALWTASENGLPLVEDLGPVGSFNWLYPIVISLVIDPVTPSTLYLGTTTNYYAGFGDNLPSIDNGVFKSTDGGANWALASNGLPLFAGTTSTHHDVLALAVNPFNPQVLYAGATSFEFTGAVGSIYKSTDGGANWFEVSTGIAGQDVRALLFDPADPTGDTVYAGTGGGAADRGGVFRTTDGGATWNSLSIGLPANAALALALPPRALGAPARIVAGTGAGVWEYTSTPDEDFDGAPSAVENSVLSGDGNGDGIQDSTQSGVASMSAIGSPGAAGSSAPEGTIVRSTIEITDGTCTQLNDSTNQSAALYPPDPIGSASSHSPWGLLSFSLPACSQATVRITFHGASFGADWKWRNYGPRIPGDATTFGWYSFAGAQRIDGETWELSIDATRQGNYRNDPQNILFIGGPGNLPDLIFNHGFE